MDDKTCVGFKITKRVIRFAMGMVREPLLKILRKFLSMFHGDRSIGNKTKEQHAALPERLYIIYDSVLAPMGGMGL